METKTAMDIREVGAAKEGIQQRSEQRLFCQLQVFSNCSDATSLISALEASGLDAVLYNNVNDPYGVGVLLMTEDPNNFVTKARCMYASVAFQKLVRIPELTMLGRTYSTGREVDLEDWLLRKPRRYGLNPEWTWAIWYPLRRKPEFQLLERAEQGKILMEHGMQGKQYAESGLAYDIRLACHGLDQNDNEFVIGLVGPELFPLSHIVQTMRKTQQTSKYIQSLGPFFVGKTAWQSPLK